MISTAEFSRSYYKLKQLDAELSIANTMYLYLLTDYDIYNIPFTCSLLIEFFFEVFNQNVLTQEPSYEKQTLLSHIPTKKPDPLPQDHPSYENYEGTTMSELEKHHEESLNTMFVDISAVESTTVEDSLKSISQQKTPEFVNATDEVLYATLKTTEGGMTRSELVEMTSIAWTTIFDSLQRLLLRGLIKRFPQHAGKVGRPKVFFQSCTQSLLAI